MVLILFRSFGMIVDLHLESVVHRHPLLARLNRNANKNSRIVILIAHAVDHMDLAIANLAASPVEQAHPAVTLDQAFFDRVSTRTHVLPSRQILTSEDLPPPVRIALPDVLILIGRKRHCYKAGKQYTCE